MSKRILCEKRDIVLGGKPQLLITSICDREVFANFPGAWIFIGGYCDASRATLQGRQLVRSRPMHSLQIGLRRWEASVHLKTLFKWVIKLKEVILTLYCQSQAYPAHSTTHTHSTSHSALLLFHHYRKIFYDRSNTVNVGKLFMTFQSFTVKNRHSPI